MRPSALLGLPEGPIGEVVEGTVAVVFPPTEGRHGPIQALKIKDAPDAPDQWSPRETEVTVQFRGRPPVPVEARGKTIRISPRLRRGEASGVAWITRPGRRGQRFPVLVITPTARVAIEDRAPDAPRSP